MWGRDMGRALMRSTLLVRCMGCRMICIRYSCRLRGRVQPARDLVGAVSEAEASRAAALVGVGAERFRLQRARGVVFKVDPVGNETVLHTFGGADGANPTSVLMLDSSGNLYGTTQNGGTSDQCGSSGC